ncbi:type IV pilus biogenesis/stability protein PilW [Pseudomonas sp. BN102]|uniref:type IV pilus biogenesis/stability protein PilW n=1 Tax=Pseudomonas sp. BN102 TaxID=2567886 RepID=UPI0024585DB8|nr:type IV pilus biogenesis/stability protein PilW [Pseudomonas sp. BN102]MDH4611332.1 type IV pilus biogenesis/stability protein PilW [Pseudomonas sp. BN102]
MTLRAALLLVSTALLAACVSTGHLDPMKTDKGRDAARDAYIELGIGYLKEGSTENAKVPLKQALELDPSNADAHAALALVFQTEREPELADQHYRKALSSRSDSRILNNYGGFLYEQGRYKDAYERFLQAAEDNLYPERSRVFENLGLTALKLNNPALAKQQFDKSLRLERRQPRALLEMAQLSFDEKQYVPARDYYDRFSKISPQNARSLLLGSRLATIFEDRDQAASLGLQLKRLYPGTPEYQQYLSEQ